MSTRSRYVRSGRKPLPRKPRSKYVPGSFEDSNKYVRCWNCGFIIDLSTVEATGNTDGNVFTDFVIAQDTYEIQNPIMSELLVDMIGHESVLVNVDAQGLPIATYTPRESIAYRGCPLCGTTNLP
jgi:hypothetical protein